MVVDSIMALFTTNNLPQYVGQGLGVSQVITKTKQPTQLHEPNYMALIKIFNETDQGTGDLPIDLSANIQVKFPNQAALDEFYRRRRQKIQNDNVSQYDLEKYTNAVSRDVMTQAIGDNLVNNLTPNVGDNMAGMLAQPRPLNGVERGAMYSSIFSDADTFGDDTDESRVRNALAQPELREVDTYTVDTFTGRETGDDDDFDLDEWEANASAAIAGARYQAAERRKQVSMLPPHLREAGQDMLNQLADFVEEEIPDEDVGYLRSGAPAPESVPRRPMMTVDDLQIGEPRAPRGAPLISQAERERQEIAYRRMVNQNRDRF